MVVGEIGRTLRRHSSQRSISSATVLLRVPRCRPAPTSASSLASTCLACRIEALVMTREMTLEASNASHAGR
jgi:hypothetical protein